MVSTFLGILIWEKLEQLMKAASPIDFNDSGKVTLANLEHSKKAFLPIASQPSEMISSVILIHLEKALSPIVQLPGIVTVPSMLEQL